ncbi:MAG: DUF4263 domain-containing protein [Aphanizomenon flos-aquae Clear-A1]|jgi:hypothetical protein|nr:DUF4263 domain-containing protein [Aphanizomenon flos-aquae Clear-A1]
MYQKRQEIEEAISSLKQLLSDEDALERHFQEWFENNPIVFNALGYKTYLAHPVLKLEDEDTLIPDFIVQRIDNLWEIFELKLPNTQILKDKKTRQTFYAPLHEYMQQCIDYSRYFNDRWNIEKFLLDTNIRIDSSPKAKLIVGRNEGLDRYKVSELLSDRGYKVELITYDDIINNLEFLKVNTFTQYEDLPGLTLHFIVLLNPSDWIGKYQNHLVAIGGNSRKNSLSVYLDVSGNFCFEIIDNNGTSHTSKIDGVSNIFETKQLMYFILEFGRGDTYSITSIEVNGKYHSFNIIDQLEIDINSSPLPIVIGSDSIGNGQSTFEIFEQIIFPKTLTLEERIYIRENVFSYYFNDDFNIKPRVKFDGQQFLRSNAHPNFSFNKKLKPSDMVQPELNKQPLIITSEMDSGGYLSVFYDQAN